jgi:cytoskeleton protein RodZ
MTFSGGQAAASENQIDPETADEQTPGAMLARERVRRGLSIQQAAEGLHLDPWIVEAIEANRFVQLGAPVYAKGYLRKYAELLGLVPGEVIARYERLSDTPGVPTPVPVITTTPPPRPKWPTYLAWVLILGVLGAVGAFAFDWWLNRPAPNAVVEPRVDARVIEEQPAGTASALESEHAEVQAAEAPAEPEAVVAEGATVDGEVQLAQQAQPTLESESPTAAPAVTGSQTRLTLEFNDASWVEAHDADGRRLMFGIGQAGQSRTLEGKAPLTVVIGVAAAVKAQVNGESIVVPRRANREATRFVVNADGTIR